MGEKDLKEWVNRRLNEGYSPQSVKDYLAKRGYSTSIVDELKKKEVSKKDMIIYSLIMVIVVLSVYTIFICKPLPSLKTSTVATSFLVSKQFPQVNTRTDFSRMEAEWSNTNCENKREDSLILLLHIKKTGAGYEIGCEEGPQISNLKGIPDVYGAYGGCNQQTAENLNILLRMSNSDRNFYIEDDIPGNLNDYYVFFNICVVGEQRFAFTGVIDAKTYKLYY